MLSIKVRVIKPKMTTAATVGESRVLGPHVLLEIRDFSRSKFALRTLVSG